MSLKIKYCAPCFIVCFICICILSLATIIWPNSFIEERGLVLVVLTSLSVFGGFRLRREEGQVSPVVEVSSAGEEKFSDSTYDFIIEIVVKLRRPIQGLLGVHDIYSTASTAEEKQEYLEISEHCCRHTLRQLERLQIFSEMKSNKTEIIKSVFSIKKCIHEAISMAQQNTLVGDGRVEESIAPDMSEFVYGCEIVLRNLFVEIIENSIKYSGSTKTRISVNPDRERPAWVRIIVSDNGASTPRVEVDRMMRAHKNLLGDLWAEARESLGMILIGCFVRVLEGELQVTDISEFESEYIFALPILTAKGIEFVEHEKMGHSKYLQVLVIEEELCVRQTASAIFRTMGMNTETAKSGHTALKKTWENQYDVILVDLDSPNFNGFEVVTKIFSDNMYLIKPRIIFMSSRRHLLDKSTFANRFECELVSKPLRLEEIKPILKRITHVE